MNIKINTDDIAQAVLDHISEGFKDGWYEDHITDFITGVMKDLEGDPDIRAAIKARVLKELEL